MRFANPWLLLSLVFPATMLWARWRERRAPIRARIAFSGRGVLDSVPVTPRVRWRGVPWWLDLAGLTLVIVALARPQLPAGKEEIRLKSRNIVVALDISSSMKATDFQPGNRLTVAREVLREFVQRRQGDLVGLVIFSGKAFLQAPLTDDVALLNRMLERIDLGLLPDGTAIGTALAMSINQLKELPPKASCIVLITDGANNTGFPTLPEATEMARALGIRVHAIGLSSSDTTQVALNGVWSVRTRASLLTARDEQTLRQVSERTGGRYARATAPDVLREVFEGIDPLERQDVIVKETRKWHELFPWLLGLGLALLALSRLLRTTWLRTVP